MGVDQIHNLPVIGRNERKFFVMFYCTLVRTTCTLAHGEKCQTACKPGSVPARKAGDDHSSGTPVAGRLARPTRATARKRAWALRQPAAPTWSCSRWGLPCRRRCRRRGALLPHHFTLAAPPEPKLRQGLGGLLSVALSLGSPPPGVTRHRVSVEPGLSSPRLRGEERPSGRLARPQWKGAREPPSQTAPAAEPSRRGLPRSRSVVEPPSQQRRPEMALEGGDHGRASPASSVPMRAVIADRAQRRLELSAMVRGAGAAALKSGHRPIPARARRAQSKKLARILLSLRRDVGMAEDARGGIGWRVRIRARQFFERFHLALGERAIAEFMAGIDELDADRGAVDVAPFPPGRKRPHARRVALRRRDARPCRPRR